MAPNVKSPPKGKQTVFQKQQKKSVSWAPGNSMITTAECCVPITYEDGTSSWYKRSDFKSFKAANQSICKLVRAIEKEQRTQHGILGYSTPKQELECCTRGLEMMMNGKERMVRRQRATSAVVEEQLNQWAQQVSSPDFIAKLYNEISSFAQNDACMLGLQDQKVAASIHEEEENNRKATTTTKTKKTMHGRESHGGIFRTHRSMARKTFAPACA